MTGMSGIQLTKEVTDAINVLRNPPKSLDGFCCAIYDEEGYGDPVYKSRTRKMAVKVVPGSYVYTEENQSGTLKKLKQFCQPNRSCYMVLNLRFMAIEDNLQQDYTKMTLLTWCPDTCQVNERMCNASTKNSLLAACGDGVVNLHASSSDELSVDTLLSNASLNKNKSTIFPCVDGFKYQGKLGQLREVEE